MTLNQKRFHYYREGRALCGNWAILGSLAGELTPDTDVPNLKDCVVCRRKLRGNEG